MTRNCDYCGESYARRPSVIGVYCSNSCKGKGNLAQQKNLTYRIAKGSVPWNKNKGRLPVPCPNCGEVNQQLISQNARFCNKACFNQSQTHKTPTKYGTIHAYIRRLYGAPSMCEHCGTTASKKFEWANISGRYLLERDDWARLCCKCHRRYDLGTKNKIEVLNV